MTTLRPFQATDILRLNSINLDRFTENFYPNYYNSYIGKWPDLMFLTQHPSGTIGSYMMGKAEGTETNWHGHVSAVTVAPQYRRMGLASLLMEELERISDVCYSNYFMDLYVRPSNFQAVSMYKNLGYIVYRRVLGYYSGEEDAYDMRKALSRDAQRKSMVPLAKPTLPNRADMT